MARNRFRAGVYQLTVPAGIGAITINIDNRNVVFQQDTNATVYVADILSFEAGKIDALWIAENTEGISGQVTG